MKYITPETLKAINKLPMRVCLKRGTYKEWLETSIIPLDGELLETSIIPLDGELILVTALPWYKSWFGLKPARLKVGDGKTKFKKLKFL